MSMHKIPLTQLEEDGLRAHGLDIGSPSQLSDVFRQGIKWVLAQTAPQQPIRLPERKRTDHLPKEYKTMTVVRAGIEAYNRALDDVAALYAAPIAQTAQHDLRAIAMLVAEAAWKAGNSRDRAVASDTLREIVNSVFDQLGMQAAPQPEQSA